MSKETTEQRVDKQQQIVERIVQALEQGQATGKWTAPWRKLGLGRPVNVQTGEQYHGGNALVLSFSDYSSPYWGTFNQWKAVGSFPRKGEKAGSYIFRPNYKKVEVPVPDDATGENIVVKDGRKVKKVQKLTYWSAYAVFNAEQVHGDWQAPTVEETRLVTPDEQVEAFLARTGARVEHGGDRAFYRPSTDHIQMPERHQFVSDAAYYAVLLHELTHWTGPENRCNRQFGKRFGDEAYAMEELVAELGAAFLGSDLGIYAPESRQDHIEYLGNWISQLRANPSVLWTVAAASEKAVTFLHDLQMEERMKDAA